MIKNKKGFTLMELLAVIVILSVLILLAMPAVLRLMESARKNAFVTESNSIVKIAQTAYTDKSMTSALPSSWCISLATLKTEGYTEKNFASNSGAIQITLNSDDSYSYKLWYTDGSNYINNKTQPNGGFTVSDIGGTAFTSICTPTE